MASRLSEENSLISIYDAGHLAVSLTPNSLTSVDKAISPIDLATVMKSPNAVDIIQKKSPIEIYRAIKLCDPELLPEVLEAISEEQFTGILDFDTWKEDRLIAKQVFSWLKLYAEISPKELYKRFSSLEEEYQLATLGPYIRIYDQEEYEKMPESFQDRLITLPSNDAYYEITAKDQETFLIIENLIEAIMANNMSYAISLLAHSAYMPPAEQEELLSRFRRSRIEEEGYVSYNESLSIFAPYAFHDLTKKIDHWNTTLSDSLIHKTEFGHLSEDSIENNRKAKQNILTPVNNTKEEMDLTFIDQVLLYGAKHHWSQEQAYNIRNSFIILANNLCAASQIETDDVSGLKVVLRQAKATAGLALEILSKKDLALAYKIIEKEYAKDLFRIGLTVITQLRNQALKLLKNLGLTGTEEVSYLLQTGKFGAAITYIDTHWLDKIGYLRVEVLKGLMNRYPVRPILPPAGVQPTPEARRTTIPKQNKIVFAPIDSLSSLQNLVAVFDQLFAPFFLSELKIKHFAEENIKHFKNFNADNLLTSLVFNALMKGKYTLTRIYDSDIESFLSLESSDFNEKSDALIASVYEYLERLDINNWSIGAGCQQYIGSDSIQSLKSVTSAISEISRILGHAKTESRENSLQYLRDILTNR